MPRRPHLWPVLQVLTPAEVARRERIVCRSAFDSGPLPIRIGPVTDLFLGPEELAAEADVLGRQPFCVRLQPPQPRSAGLPPPAQLCICVALRQGASPHDVLAALAAACEARRRLLLLAGDAGGVTGGAAHTQTPCCSGAWWAEGAVTAAARAQVAAAQRAGMKEARRAERALRSEGWLCDSVMLSQSERVRYSLV